MPLVQHTMRHSPTCFPRQIHSAVSQSPTIWIHPFPYPFPYPFPFHPLSTNQLETNPQPILSRSIHDSAIRILHFNSFGDKRLHPNFHSSCRVKDMYVIRFYNQINGLLKSFPSKGCYRFILRKQLMMCWHQSQGICNQISSLLLSPMISIISTCTPCQGILRASARNFAALHTHHSWTLRVVNKGKVICKWICFSPTSDLLCFVYWCLICIHLWLEKYECPQLSTSVSHEPSAGASAWWTPVSAVPAVPAPAMTTSRPPRPTGAKLLRYCADGSRGTCL